MGLSKQAYCAIFFGVFCVRQIMKAAMGSTVNVIFMMLAAAALLYFQQEQNRAKNAVKQARANQQALAQNKQQQQQQQQAAPAPEELSAGGQITWASGDFENMVAAVLAEHGNRK